MKNGLLKTQNNLRNIFDIYNKREFSEMLHF